MIEAIIPESESLSEVSDTTPPSYFSTWNWCGMQAARSQPEPAIVTTAPSFPISPRSLCTCFVFLHQDPSSQQEDLIKVFPFLDSRLESGGLAALRR